ncbi:RNA 2',3'-cyclic phosphodiesterase [Ornithinibacillus massiliensis]|uniref:RNA 2',3'-cyclic phosphodiesterase n=1 Tax=Ornithinibacillus massiliensis TaxID=1944633 RepID=A0ABS5MI10_9BACI|nr:RNA 2',3'-cyclic phosphodiesterase [Ornithinibacillus massiliensis]MBS3681972.1 RNA 2',3'-cyclic phosphodiesterase [Ornithinibacillus massiliensis]
MGQIPHYFIAIPVSTELKEKFFTWQESLKQNISYKVWPHQEDLHITLKFLGAVEEQQLKQLRNNLATIIYTAFTLTVGGIGTFGKHDNPRVVWAGVKKNTNLEGLFLKIESVVTEIGFPSENRPYRPHITLAKKWLESYHARALDEAKEQFAADYFQMNVDEFVLYQIYPSKSPKYQIVERYRLKRG